MILYQTKTPYLKFVIFVASWKAWKFLGFT